MLTSFVAETDNPEVAVSTASGTAGDEVLVISAKNGDKEAFEALVRRYGRRILRVALHFTRVQEDAEDITQQSFQKAFIHLHAFEGKSSFSTWLTRIAMNEALMLLRRGRRLKQMTIDRDSTLVEAVASPVDIKDSGLDPEASYLQGEKARLMSAALSKLKPGLRKVIELRYLEELSTEETALRMGLSFSATKSSISRGKRRLREALRLISPRTGGARTADARQRRTLASPAFGAFSACEDEACSHREFPVVHRVENSRVSVHSPRLGRRRKIEPGERWPPATPIGRSGRRSHLT